MNKLKKIYICQECGRQSLNWLGKCPACQSWNSFAETNSTKLKRVSNPANPGALPKVLSGITGKDEERFSSGTGELDRVLGGGIVPGAVILTGGEPGIGKSTLLLQIASSVAESTGAVAYITGEETAGQVKIRARRLDVAGNNLYIITDTNLDSALEQAETIQPSLLIVDSIQSVYTPESENLPGSLNQLRLSTQKVISWAKSNNCPVFLTGHVTKDGTIAGPRVLEHMVDVVCYLEGEAFQSYRILRSVKNRFGSTNEVGIFEMQKQGLIEVINPSHVFLSDRLADTIGSAVVPTLEGSRPLLVEVQALTNLTVFGQPRRVANGVDFGRLLMLIAVLSRRCSLKLGNQDIIVNATGGIRLSEPAADLSIALAIASSYKDQPLNPELTAVGEVGLSGEIRAVPKLDRRLAEASRLGFKQCLVPDKGLVNYEIAGIKLVPVNNLRQALKAGLVRGAEKNV